MKRCWKCRETKTLVEFSRNKTVKDGYQDCCKECGRIYQVKRQLRNKEKFGNLYGVWRGMLQRCSNPNHQSFKYYGSKGITVCQEWRDSFQTFYDWAIENRHKKGLQIDRRDNNGDYCPENCRVTTLTENIRNCSATKLNIEEVKEIRNLLGKKKLSQKKIGAIFGINQAMVSHIKVRMSWAEV